MPKKYSPELCERVVWVVLERHAAVGVRVRTRSGLLLRRSVLARRPLGLWCNRYGCEVGAAPVSESLQEENKRLKRELAEARRANEIFKAASAFFGVSPVAWWQFLR